MTWLTIDPDEYNMEVRQAYGKFAHALHGPSGLTMLQRQMIAVVVSSINGCHF